MKFGRILRDSPDGKIARLVVVEPEKGRVIDLARAAALHYAAKLHATPDAARRFANAAFPGSMAEALAMGDYLADQSNDIVAARGDDASIEIDGVDWLPASDPPVLRDGLNFLGHIKNWSAKMGRTVPDAMERIIPYCQNSPSMVIGNNAIVPWPGYIKRMDYELELGWVIGRRSTNVTPDNALDSVFGVTLYNDFSGRDLQQDEVAIGMGGTKAKNFAHGIGPWITTLDEFKDVYSIEMEVRLNGETKGKGVSKDILWRVEEVLSFISLGEYLQPGDVIGSGTLEGGSALEHDIILNPGDVIELEAKGVGILRNVLGTPQEGLWWPTAQPGKLS
ncbi:fumarylacetoacetate hydrolase family protein [Sphingopyxis sp. GC21]|uniref:fumarylacetoacetate hydrolase family protein n=1 Tax=Sphingopyxis sp. GC21 TaxID=2933562 RepID=UPI0021E48E44|nr:fumarylacetoacetate hydrolase family protein [Sphingopyxis sp. GC21]